MRTIEVVRNSAASLFSQSVGGSVVNLRARLEQAFISQGFSEITAFELSSEWLPRYVGIIREDMQAWEQMGIPAPIALDEERRLVFGSGHERYASEHPFGLDDEFWSIADEISGLGPREMLFCTVALLYAMGSSRILIVDGTNDGGVDAVGHVTSGAFAGFIFFAQSKSSSSSLSKNLVRSELAKFNESPKQCSNYISAVRGEATGCGSSFIYLVATNQLFEDAALEYAYQANVLLRSRLQIAHAFRKARITRAAFRNGLSSISGRLYRDLNRNVVPALAEVFT